jgi:hypothetical protein
MGARRGVAGRLGEGQGQAGRQAERDRGGERGARMVGWWDGGAKLFRDGERGGGGDGG